MVIGIPWKFFFVWFSETSKDTSILNCFLNNEKKIAFNSIAANQIEIINKTYVQFFYNNYRWINFQQSLLCFPVPFIKDELTVILFIE